jgi:hypothetical protein
MVRCGSKNRYPKDMSLKDYTLKSMLISVVSIVNIIGGGVPI